MKWRDYRQGFTFTFTFLKGYGGEGAAKSTDAARVAGSSKKEEKRQRLRRLLCKSVTMEKPATDLSFNTYFVGSML